MYYRADIPRTKYQSPFAKPAPHRWYMPTVKNPGATTKTKNGWIPPTTNGESI